MRRYFVWEFFEFTVHSIDIKSYKVQSGWKVSSFPRTVLLTLINWSRSWQMSSAFWLHFCNDKKKRVSGPNVSWICYRKILSKTVRIFPKRPHNSYLLQFELPTEWINGMLKNWEEKIVFYSFSSLQKSQFLYCN